MNIIIIIIIKAICNAQDPLKKAANALSGSLKMLLSIFIHSFIKSVHKEP